MAAVTVAPRTRYHEGTTTTKHTKHTKHTKNTTTETQRRRVWPRRMSAGFAGRLHPSQRTAETQRVDAPAVVFPSFFAGGAAASRRHATRLALRVLRALRSLFV